MTALHQMPVPESDQSLSLIQLINRYWLTIAACGLLGFLVGVSAYFLLPKSYRAEVVVATTEADIFNGGGMSQLAQLSGLAGMTLPSASSSYRQEAIATIKSRDIAKTFISKNDIAQSIDSTYPELESLEGMTVAQRDERLDRATERFLTRVLDVREDRRSGMIVVAVTWGEPRVAAAWANGLVELADDRLRTRRRRNADDNLVLIEDAISKTSTIELRQTLYRMFQLELEKKLQTQVKDSIFFRIIDPAVPPDIRRPHSPDTRLVIIGSTLLGCLLGLGLSMFLASRRMHQ